jgi:hypothetical protein
MRLSRAFREILQHRPVEAGKWILESVGGRRAVVDAVGGKMRYWKEGMEEKK